MLIEKCLCGESRITKRKKNGIDVGYCIKCGIARQLVDLSPTEYTAFYQGHYANKHQEEIGHTPYGKRYKEDVEVSKKRLKSYNDQIKTLDVGCANAAHVAESAKQGYDAYGTDLTKENINKKINDRIYLGELKEINFPTYHFDIITLHDVLEHFVDPISQLKEIRRVLKTDGRLYIDFPDFFHAKGKKHWRKTQHLWLLSDEQLENLLIDAGFDIQHSYNPITGKIVKICKKPKIDIKKILVLPGIGDIYWVLAWLEDFLKKEKITEPPDVYIWNFDGRPRSIEYLRKHPMLHAAGYSDMPRTGKNAEIFHKMYIVDGYRAYPNFGEFDYLLSVNGLLREGKSMKEMGYNLNWYPRMFESIKQKGHIDQYEKELGDYVLCAFSNNGMFTNWAKEMPPDVIADMLIKINKLTGNKLVFSGSEWDIPFNSQIVARLPKNTYTELTGQTDIDQLIALIKASNGMIGWCGGNTILSTVLKNPTLMLWNGYFKNPGFFKNCCPPDSLGKWYFPFTTDKTYEIRPALLKKLFRRKK